MSAIDWLRTRFSAPGVDPSGAAVFMTTYGQNGNEGALVTQVSSAVQGYYTNAVVFGAVLARMSLFSEATFEFEELETSARTGKNELDSRKNTSLRILEKPWANGGTGELLARMIQDVDLTGNAYIWHVEASTFYPERLVRLRPDWVTIISELREDALGREYREVVGYFYEPPPNQPDHGRSTILTVDEVAHWSPNPDPMANFRGMSWMTPVLRDITSDNAMTDYKIKYLENAASPNLLVKYAHKIGDKAVERVQSMIQARHGGLDNAFKTIVLDEGADATVIGNTFEQMNFSTVQAAGENRIVIASGVPGIVIGSKEGLMAATYSNYEQAMRRFADLTMRPLWRSVCQCLAKFVKVPAGSKLAIDLDDIAALRTGETELATITELRAKAVLHLAQAGLYTAESIAAAVESGDMCKLEVLPEPPPAPEPIPLPVTPPALPSAPTAPLTESTGKAA